MTELEGEGRGGKGAGMALEAQQGCQPGGHAVWPCGCVAFQPSPPHFPSKLGSKETLTLLKSSSKARELELGQSAVEV